MTYRAWDLKTLDRAAVRELTHAIAEQRTEELEYSAMDEEPWSEQKYAATLAAHAQKKRPPGGGLTGAVLQCTASHSSRAKARVRASFSASMKGTSYPRCRSAWLPRKRSWACLQYRRIPSSNRSQPRSGR